MKKAIIAVCLMLSFSIVPAGQAATPDDLFGEWQVSSNDTLIVQGLGTDPGGQPGTCTFISNMTYAATFGSLDYSGTFDLDAKGKKMTWNLSSAGAEELKDMLEQWIYDWASTEVPGIGLVSVEFQSIVCKVIKIDKNTNRPISALLKVKGTASASVGEDLVTKKIKYTSLITFQSGPTEP